MSISGYGFKDAQIQPIADAHIDGEAPTREAMGYVLWALMMRESQVGFLNREIDRPVVDLTNQRASLAAEREQFERERASFRRRKSLTLERLAGLERAGDAAAMLGKGLSGTAIARELGMHPLHVNRIARRVSRVRSAERAQERAMLAKKEQGE